MSDKPEAFTLTIDGRAAPASRTFDVVNPATGAVFAAAPDATPEQVDAAFEAAGKAFADWRLEDAVRRRALRAVADTIEAAGEEIAQLLTAEHGKRIADSRREVARAVEYYRYYAGIPFARQVLRDDDQAVVELVHRPMGPVAVIAPWNFPITISSAKVAPALRAGNTVVLKPSPFTPLSTLRIGELLRGVLPGGVLNVLTGGDEVGRLMTTHPLARKISFTGSIPTGKAIAAAAAGDLKRTTLELGGNDAVVVLDDADPVAVAQGIFARAFYNTGQVCVAPKRIYAPESLRPALVGELAELARTVKLGDGSRPDTQMGPLNNPAQRDRVVELVEDAVAHGATVAAGGKVVDGPGFFYEPTVVTDIFDGVRLVDEEQFGPVLPVIGYTDLDDAIAAANNTQFGLGSSVWGTDGQRAAAVAERLEAGMTWVNGHGATTVDQPFAGIKWSGIGVENGHWALEGFTELQVLHHAK